MEKKLSLAACVRLLIPALLTLLLLCGPVAAARAVNLYWGSSGRDVILVQTRLRDWGYYRGTVDGFYGSSTQQAVANFQLDNGLPPDGIVDASTWAALGYSTPGDESAGSTSPEPVGGSRGISNHDSVYLLAKVIEGEAANEPFDGKVAVGAVIVNRTKSAAFAPSVPAVVFQSHAFESVSNGQYNRPVSSECLRAATLAMNGWDPTGGALFFWNPAKPVQPWIWSRKIITQIGNHVFAE